MEVDYNQNSSGGVDGFFYNETNQNQTQTYRLGGGGLSAARLLHTAALLDYYYTPLLCFLGCMGNCLSVVVFCINANHRSLSSSYYLSALAISDTGFLINLFTLWLDGMGVGVLSTNFGCPFVMFSGQVTCFLSVWLTVAFTIERFFAVCSPLTRPRICTVSKAKKVICGLSAFALIAFSYVFFIARVLPSHEAFYHEKNHYNSSTQMNQFINPVEETLASESSFNAPRPHPPDNDGGSTTASSERKSYEAPLPETFGDYTLFPTFDTFSMPLDVAQNKLLAADAQPKSISTTEHFSSSNIRMINESALKGVNLNTGEDDFLVCTVPLEYLTVSIVANYLDSMITLIIPFCLIAFFNMRIATCVWRLKDERKSIIAFPKSNNGPTTTSGFKAPTHKGRGVNRKQSSDFDGESQHRRKRGNANRMSRVCVCGSIFQQQRTNSSSSLDSPINEENNEVCSCKNNFNSGDNKCIPVESKLNLFEENQELGKIQTHSTLSLKGDAAPCGSSNNEAISSDISNVHLCSLHHKKISRSSLNRTRSHKNKKDDNPNNSMTLNPTHLRNEASNSTSSCSRAKSRFNKRLASVTYSSSETRVTKMLLLVSTVFLVLNLPSHAFRAASFIQRLLWEDDIEGQNRLHAAQQLSNILLFNTNFAVNFLLYCLSGRNFRQSLRNIFLGKSKRMALNRISRKPKGPIVRNRAHFGSRRAENETVVLDDVSVGEKLNPFHHGENPNQMQETCT